MELRQNENRVWVKILTPYLTKDRVFSAGEVCLIDKSTAGKLLSCNAAELICRNARNEFQNKMINLNYKDEEK